MKKTRGRCHGGEDDGDLRDAQDDRIKLGTISGHAVAEVRLLILLRGFAFDNAAFAHTVMPHFICC